MVWLSDRDKMFENVITRFDTIQDRDGRTDGQTPQDSIGRVCAYSVARQKV